ncbi:ShlB/FhaC/HecB family hemolysin secretion/activation protein [Methylogaea oryzae]|uniref:ShlB/FhaC/HecB family hemolysin secretion/activation protein n=1 Tax=Methylogaea oryzae TaxID=1295382 RepID=UPI0006D152D3|nr:ShlB/FhaC/HecB family hemolysin secretion/activation protein [Methylogaea oryzae]
MAAAGQVQKQGLAEQDLNPFDPGLAIDVSRLPVLQDRGFVESLKPFLDAPLDAEHIQKLTQQVNLYLQSSQALAHVSIPEQDATSGVVQVLVLQSRLGTVKVEGAEHFPESAYRENIRLQPGDAIDLKRLDEDLAWIQRSNSYRSATAVVVPGGRPGETDIAVRVTEQKPWNVRLTADNTGLDSTRNERLGMSATHANLLGLGHIGNYSLATSPDSDTYRAHSGSYTVPLPWRDILTLSGSYADIHALLPAPLNSTGYSATASARYEKPLAELGGYTHSAILGIDYKAANTNVLFSTAPVFNNITNIFQFIAGYRGSWQDAYGRTGFNANLVYSPGGITGDNRDDRFSASRAGAKSQYVYGNLTLDRLTYLPMDWTWALNARLQVANENLLGSEQLYGAGTYAVRGFREGLLYADEGFVVRNEVGPPTLYWIDAFRAQVYGFLDGARTNSVNRLPGERVHKIASVGFGTKVSVMNHFDVRAEFGHVLATNLDGRTGDGLRAHIGLSASFKPKHCASSQEGVYANPSIAKFRKFGVTSRTALMPHSLGKQHRVQAGSFITGNVVEHPAGFFFHQTLLTVPGPPGLCPGTPPIGRP